MTRRKKKSKIPTRPRRSNTSVTPAAVKSNALRTPADAARNRIAQHVHLSDCSRDYIQALMDPFSGVLACVPTNYINSNRIATAFARGNFACGANGGFIAIDPQCFAFNDIVSVISSKASYTGSAFDLNTATIDANRDLSNSDYASASLGPGGNDLSMRVVGCGLKVWYTGREVDMGGFIVALHDPTHTTLFNRGFNSVLGEQQARRLPADRTPVTILYYPVEDSDYSMRDSALPSTAVPPNIAVNTSHYYMGALIQPSNSTTNNTYAYEAFGIYEFQGRNIRSQKVTHGDPQGLVAAVSAAINTPPSKTPPATKVETATKDAIDYLSTGLSYAYHQIVAPAIDKAAYTGKFSPPIDLGIYDWLPTTSKGVY